MLRVTRLSIASALVAVAVAVSNTQAQEKPNILVIWGDDVGWNNPSAYHRGMMGYETPNIDRIAKEGMLFTDWYGQSRLSELGYFSRVPPGG